MHLPSKLLGVGSVAGRAALAAMTETSEAEATETFWFGPGGRAQLVVTGVGGSSRCFLAFVVDESESLSVLDANAMDTFGNSSALGRRS